MMLTISTYTLATLVIAAFGRHISTTNPEGDIEKLQEFVWFADAPNAHYKQTNTDLPTFLGISGGGENELEEFVWFSDDGPISRFKAKEIPMTSSRPEYSFSDLSKYSSFGRSVQSVIPTTATGIQSQPYFSYFSAYSNLPIHYNYGITGK